MRNGAWIQLVTGTVTGVNRWSDTHVSSSGGGGYITAKGGYIRPPTVSSEVVQRNQVFVRQSDGVETSLELGDLIAVREGQNITAVIAGQEGETGEFFFLYNRATTRTWSKLVAVSSALSLLYFFLILIFFWGLSVLLFSAGMQERSIQGATRSDAVSSVESRTGAVFANCVASIQQHRPPACSASEKVESSKSGPICVCKSPRELLAALQLPSQSTPAVQVAPIRDQDAGEVWVLLAVAAVVSGPILAAVTYSRTKRSRRARAREFFEDVANESTHQTGIHFALHEDEGSFHLTASDPALVST